MSILVQDITKQFGDFLAVDNVSLKVESDSLVALLGPSGSGKSTLLRIMAGLEAPDRGQVWIENEDATYRSVQERQIGFVFQHYALFKHLTVRNNIAFGLNIRKASKSLVKQKVDELLDLIQLRGLGDRYPSQLSGGQRQRVALARSLSAQPKTLLHGRVEQIGTPAEIYDNPASEFVMRFIGETNVISGARRHFPDLEIADHHQVFLRPRDLAIRSEPEETFAPATVSYAFNLGWEGQAELVLSDNQKLIVKLERDRFDSLSLYPQKEV